MEEQHIGVYTSKTDDHMVKAPRPKKLLPGSLVSPSLAAAVINGKYVNAVPLYRYPVIQADELCEALHNSSYVEKFIM